jgi:DNA-binding NtrC family response regulator
MAGVITVVPVPGSAELSSQIASPQQIAPAEIASQLNVLVVDDDDSVRNACREVARKLGHQTYVAESVPAARSVLKGESIDVLLLDLKLPGGGGLSLLEEVKSLYPDTVVVVMTAFATVNSAVEAMRIGASDYLTKPFAIDELTAMLERAAERRNFDAEARRLRGRLRTEQGFGKIVGRSPEMDRLYRILSKVAFAGHPVLILGESGTGKEMVARAIHTNGPNAAHPFIPVDCGSLLPTMVESELFGYTN